MDQAARERCYRRRMREKENERILIDLLMRQIAHTYGVEVSEEPPDPPDRPKPEDAL
jgi:hypothetical protein